MVLEVGSRNVLKCRPIRASVLDLRRDLSVDLAVQDEVDEGMGAAEVRRTLGDAHGVDPQQRPFLGDNVGEVVVLRYHLLDVAGPLHADVHLAHEQQVLASIGSKRLDVGLGLDQRSGGLVDLPLVPGVERVAEQLERGTDDVDVVQQRDPTLESVRG